MIVEAIKKSDGFYIPFVNELADVTSDRILMKIEIIEQQSGVADYAALDSIVGLCETHVRDSSEKHDEIIYGKRK